MQNFCVVYTCNRSAGYSMHTENVHVVHSVLTGLKKLKLQNEQHVLYFPNSLFFFFFFMGVLHILTENHFVALFYQGYNFFE